MSVTFLLCAFASVCVMGFCIFCVLLASASQSNELFMSLISCFLLSFIKDACC